MENCYICTNHYSQGGKCYENKDNCLFFIEEPRGKMVRTTLTFELNCNAETSIISYNRKIIIEDKGKYIEMTVIRINWFNLKNMTCNVDVEYHENEMPSFERKKLFQIIR